MRRYVYVPNACTVTEKNYEIYAFAGPTQAPKQCNYI